MLSRRISRPMATVMTAAALAVVGAAPAMAGPIDRPLLDTTQVDFGNSWSNQAPTSGGTLDWDTGNGNTCLDGHIYLKNANNVTAQVWLEIYPNAAHGANPIATTKSARKTATSNALNTFAVNVQCQNSSGTHAHVVVADDHASIGGALQPTATAFENE